jgi:hypothetical protein
MTGFFERPVKHSEGYITVNNEDPTGQFQQDAIPLKKLILQSQLNLEIRSVSTVGCGVIPRDAVYRSASD